MEINVVSRLELPGICWLQTHLDFFGLQNIGEMIQFGDRKFSQTTPNLEKSWESMLISINLKPLKPDISSCHKKEYNRKGT